MASSKAELWTNLATHLSLHVSTRAQVNVLPAAVTMAQGVAMEGGVAANHLERRQSG
jgi:hypothetical protein